MSFCFWFPLKQSIEKDKNKTTKYINNKKYIKKKNTQSFALVPFKAEYKK